HSIRSAKWDQRFESRLLQRRVLCELRPDAAAGGAKVTRCSAHAGTLKLLCEQLGTAKPKATLAQLLPSREAKHCRRPLSAGSASPSEAPRGLRAPEKRGKVLAGSGTGKRWFRRGSVVAGDYPERVTRKLQNVEPGVRAIDDVDIPAVVGGDIVRLDHLPADIWVALVWAAPIIGVLRNSGDIKRHVFGAVRIADIEGAHAGVEVGDEHDFLVKRRPEFLVCRVRPEAATDVAEPAFGCRHLRSGNRLRPSLVRDICHKREMAKLGAKMRRRLRGYHHNIAQ